MANSDPWLDLAEVAAMATVMKLPNYENLDPGEKATLFVTALGYELEQLRREKRQLV